MVERSQQLVGKRARIPAQSEYKACESSKTGERTRNKFLEDLGDRTR